jgi:hypothetical protein
MNEVEYCPTNLFHVQVRTLSYHESRVMQTIILYLILFVDKGFTFMLAQT